MVYLMILIIVLINGLTTVFRKNYVDDNINVRNSLNVYMLLAHPVAAIYFFIMAGGKVPLNMPSFWFAFVFAWICIASVLFTMLACNKINLVYISIFSGAGGVVVPFVFDMIRGEMFSLYGYISIVLRMCAVLLPLVFEKSEKKGLNICIILFFVTGIAGIIPKLYGEWNGVVSDASFCFWTNIIILPIITIAIFISDKPEAVFQDFKKIKVSGYVYIILGTVIGNFATLISIEALRHINPTMYSVLNTSLGMILTAVISAVLYKEKQSTESIISLLISLAAVVTGVI